VDCETTCNAFVADASGAFAYGYGYNVQTYKSYNGERLKFDYTLFSINGNNGGHWLRIYDGPNTSFPMIGQYNNFNFIPASIESTGEFLTFEFDRNNTNAGVGNSQGYEGIMTCTTPALPVYTMGNGTLNVCEGVFYDDAGPAVNYTNGQSNVQTFCSANNQLLRIVFNVNETGFGAGDTLWAYDGPNISSPPLGIYFSGSRIEPLTSTGTCLTFRFTSNATANSRGWQGVISCITTPPAPNTYVMSSGTRYVCNGTFLDPGGTGNYPVGAGNVWNQTFTSYSGERLRATVNSLSINGNNGGHWLRVYDGPSTASPLIGSYNNFNGWPPAFESTGSSLTFRFESTNTNAGSGSGWVIAFSCFTGSPIDVAWLNSPVCRGTAIDVPYTVNASVNANNTYTVQLSNASGSFASPTTIGTLASTALTGTITANIPVGTAPGNGYRIRVNSSQPVQLGSPSPNPITIIATPVQPGSISTNGSTTFCSGQGSSTLSITNQAGMNYQWIRNGTVPVGTNSNSFVASQPGVYTVAIYNNCDSIISTSSVTINSIDAPVAATITANGPVTFCAGGSVQLSIPAQTGVSYQWKNGTVNVGTNSNTFTATAAGVYTVTLSNSCGTVVSVNDITVTISGNAPTAPSITANNTIICDGSSATLSVTAQSGVNYQWKLNGNNIGTNSNTLSAGQAGVYTVELSNSCGTVLSNNSITLTVNQAPAAASITAGGPTTFCQGQSVQLSVNAQSGVSYQWTLNGSNVGTNSNTLTATQAGDYTVSLNNSCGTTAASNTVTVSLSGVAPTAPTISANGPTGFCAGGSVNLSAPSQTGVTYQWTLDGNNIGGNTNSLTANQSGIYELQVSNTCGNVVSVNTITVTVNALPSAPVISAAGSTTLCSGQSLTLQNPVNATSYLWSNGATTQNISVSTAGSYHVVITDANGCTSLPSNTITVNVTTPPAAPTLQTAVPICAGNSAQLTVNSSVSVNWFNTLSGGTPIGTGLTFNTPVLNVSSTFYAESNDNGCASLNRLEVNVTVFANPVITVDSIIQAGCNNAPDGAIYVSVTGGLPPFNFLWNTGATTFNLTGIAAGVYTLNITDVNSCTASQNNINVNSNASINASAQITDVDCPGALNGMIQVITTGGTPPFSYDWGNGQTDPLAVFLSGGDYFVTITDAANCVSIQGPYFVFEPDAIQLNFSVTDQTSTSLGEISLNVSGGTPPYSFLWDNNETTQNLVDLTAGTYSVMVMDDNSCIANGSATVNLVTGLEQNSLVQVQIYPNPVVNNLMIELPENGLYRIELLDMNGKLISSIENKKGRQMMDFTDLPVAVYLLQVTDVNHQQMEYKKVIKR
jgi:hypothetical protein